MSARSPGTIASVPSSELVDEMLDAHRGDPHLPHLALEDLTALEQDRGVQLRRHLGDRWVRELGALREDVHGLFSVLRRQSCCDRVHVCPATRFTKAPKTVQPLCLSDALAA